MYINKPSATKIEAADRVNLLHSGTFCRFDFKTTLNVVSGSSQCQQIISVKKILFRKLQFQSLGQ